MMAYKVLKSIDLRVCMWLGHMLLVHAVARVKAAILPPFLNLCLNVFIR